MNREQQIVKARKAGFAAFVGTTIEWYDFYVYATAAALVFGDIFLPTRNRPPDRRCGGVRDIRRRFLPLARSAESCSAMSVTRWADAPHWW